jgi:hypothetical protein
MHGPYCMDHDPYAARPSRRMTTALTERKAMVATTAFWNSMVLASTSPSVSSH